MNEITILAIDLAKSVFQLHGIDGRNLTVLRRQVRRAQLLSLIAQLPPCVVAMEACASAHYWGRTLQCFGHTVRLMAPQFVKPYVKTNKNDVADAEAICEAVSRPNMRFVPIKSIEQQAILSVHRVRQGLKRGRMTNSRANAWPHGRFGSVALCRQSLPSMTLSAPRAAAQPNAWDLPA